MTQFKSYLQLLLTHLLALAGTCWHLLALAGLVQRYREQPLGGHIDHRWWDGNESPQSLRLPIKGFYDAAEWFLIKYL